MLSSLDMTKIAVKALDSKMAGDIKVLNIEKVSTLADYFIICSANATTHIKTLADEVDRLLTEAGEQAMRTEGRRDGGWVLVDYGCLVVHIFLEDSRKFYSLERLWGDAPQLDVAELLK